MEMNSYSYSVYSYAITFVKNMIEYVSCLTSAYRVNEKRWVNWTGQNKLWEKLRFSLESLFTCSTRLLTCSIYNYNWLFYCLPSCPLVLYWLFPWKEEGALLTPFLFQFWIIAFYVCFIRIHNFDWLPTTDHTLTRLWLHVLSVKMCKRCI